MATLQDTILAATAKTILTGAATVKKITVQAATPGTFAFYDSVGNIITWTRVGYDKNQFTSGATITSTQDACGGEQVANITRTGRDNSTLSVAGGSVTKPVIAVLMDGCCCYDGDLELKHGLTVVGSVAATVIVEYYT